MPTPIATPVTEVILSAQYPRLVQYAPALGLPAQTLRIAVTGVVSPIPDGRGRLHLARVGFDVGRM